LGNGEEIEKQKQKTIRSLLPKQGKNEGPHKRENRREREKMVESSKSKGKKKIKRSRRHGAERTEMSG